MENAFLTKIKSSLKSTGFHASKVMNPHNHWRILLWVFSTVVVILIIFSLYLLRHIENEKIFQVEPTISDRPNIIKDNLIKRVTEEFDQKAQKESSLKANPPVYTDPSL